MEFRQPNWRSTQYNCLPGCCGGGCRMMLIIIMMMKSCPENRWMNLWQQHKGKWCIDSICLGAEAAAAVDCWLLNWLLLLPRQRQDVCNFWLTFCCLCCTFLSVCAAPAYPEVNANWVAHNCGWSFVFFLVIPTVLEEQTNAIRKREELKKPSLIYLAVERISSISY